MQLDVRLLFLFAKNLTNCPDAVICSHDSTTLSALLDQKGVLDLSAGSPAENMHPHAPGGVPPLPLGQPPAPLAPSPCVTPWSWVLFTGPLRLMQPTGIALALGHVDVQVATCPYTHLIHTLSHTYFLIHTLSYTLSPIPPLNPFSLSTHPLKHPRMHTHVLIL